MSGVHCFRARRNVPLLKIAPEKRDRVLPQCQTDVTVVLDDVMTFRIPATSLSLNRDTPPVNLKVDSAGDDGEAVPIKVADGHARSADEALEQAKAFMVQLTAYGTRGGGRSINQYDAASNGNFDDDEPLLDTFH
jgi:hypothetical protein